MLVDKLESGFLLFETPQGMVRAELSFWQRVYLLWTFRNFRQLSLQLLNSRQRDLVRELYRHNLGIVPSSEETWPVIGIVENFVPAADGVEISPAQASEPQRDVLPVSANEGRYGAAIAQNALKIAEAANTFSAWLSSLSRFSPSRVALAVGALLLGIVFVAGWHGSREMSSVEADNQPQLQQASAIPALTSAPQLNQVINQAESGTAAVRALAPTLPSTPEVTEEARPLASVAAIPKRNARTKAEGEIPKVASSVQDPIVQASRAPIHIVYPVYPNIHVKGGVVLTARVDSDGVVRSVQVISGQRLLAAAAVRAVRQWRYRPFLKDGEPIATETNILISFIAEDAISMSFPPSIPAAR